MSFEVQALLLHSCCLIFKIEMDCVLEDRARQQSRSSLVEQAGWKLEDKLLLLGGDQREQLLSKQWPAHHTLLCVLAVACVKHLSQAISNKRRDDQPAATHAPQLSLLQTIATHNNSQLISFFPSAALLLWGEWKLHS